MENKRLAESEYRFMNLIWEREPIASMQLVTLCETQFDWKKSTTYTVLKRLAEKGFVKNENAIVTSLIPRQKVQAFESEKFVEQTFAGSLPGFLTSFLGGKTISAKEAAELKRLIDEHQEN